MHSTPKGRTIFLQVLTEHLWRTACALLKFVRCVSPASPRASHVGHCLPLGTMIAAGTGDAEKGGAFGSGAGAALSLHSEKPFMHRNSLNIFLSAPSRSVM